MDRLSRDATSHKALPELTESRTGLNLAPVLTASVLSTAPEDFGSGSSSGPEHAVNIDGIGLLGPDMDLASQNQRFVFLGDAGERIVRINYAPVVSRITIVIIWPCIFGNIALSEVEPLALTAIEILKKAKLVEIIKNKKIALGVVCL